MIKTEFKRQAGDWAKRATSPDLRWVVDHLHLRPHFRVLDVGAGTGLLARALSPHVADVVALDLTPEMLEAGKQAAEREGLTNLRFELGAAETIPFPAGSFDLVVCRWLLHHLAHPIDGLREMARVALDNGCVVVVDLVSPTETSVAHSYNQLQRWRDPSHSAALSIEGLDSLFEQAGLEVDESHKLDVEEDLTEWLSVRNSEDSGKKIRTAVMQELSRTGPETGLRPFCRGNAIMFTHTLRMAVSHRLRRPTRTDDGSDRSARRAPLSLTVLGPHRHDAAQSG